LDRGRGAEFAAPLPGLPQNQPVFSTIELLKPAVENPTSIYFLAINSISIEFYIEWRM